MNWQDKGKELLSTHRGLVLGAFAGVLTAELLSSRVSPVVAWLAGGTLIGLVPLGCEAPRSARRILVTTASTAAVAALAHWIAIRILS